MTGQDQQPDLAAKVAQLQIEHRDLDAAITALAATSTPDLIQLARLKKRKLRLKDEIKAIQDMMIPDIIA